MIDLNLLSEFIPVFRPSHVDIHGAKENRPRRVPLSHLFLWNLRTANNERRLTLCALLITTGASRQFDYRNSRLLLFIIFIFIALIIQARRLLSIRGGIKARTTTEIARFVPFDFYRTFILYRFGGGGRTRGMC